MHAHEFDRIRRRSDDYRSPDEPELAGSQSRNVSRDRSFEHLEAVPIDDGESTRLGCNPPDQVVHGLSRSREIELSIG